MNSNDEAIEALVEVGARARYFASTNAEFPDWDRMTDRAKESYRDQVRPVVAAVRAEAVAEQAKLDQAESTLDLAEMRRWAHQTPDRFARDAVLACADEVERTHRMAGQAVADERRRIERAILNTVDPVLPGVDVRMACVEVVRAAGSVPVATPEPLDEWQCPNCGARTRARMSDKVATPPAEPATGTFHDYETYEDFPELDRKPPS